MSDNQPNPDRDVEFVVIVRRRLLGKPDHIPKAAYAISKVLHENFTQDDADDRIKVFWTVPSSDGPDTFTLAHEVLYDRFTDDGNHTKPPWWEEQGERASQD